MEISKIKAVIFDCDGVMFDTSTANRIYYNEVLENFGKSTMDEEQFVNVHMMDVKSAIAYLFPEREDLRDVFECLKNIGYQKFIPYMDMEPGLIELLNGLKSNGYIRGIGTNRTNTMEKVLVEFDLASYFEIVVTAADVEKPKPAPDQLLMIMEQLKLTSEQILFVGDSEYDCQAAQNASVGFVAFKNKEMDADFHVETMDEIAGILHLN